MDGSLAVGTLEASYAERLIAGDRFVLDGRVFKFRRLEHSIVHARCDRGEPNLPRWTSDRQSLSFELARELAVFREEASRRLHEASAAGLRDWLMGPFELEHGAAAVLAELFQAQAQWSEIPDASGLLVEEVTLARRRRSGVLVSRPPAPRGVRGAGRRNPRPGWAGVSGAICHYRSPTWGGRSGWKATPPATGSS